MGASSAEIDQQIKETRQHLDENLGLLERRAVSGAKRMARIGAAVGVGLAVTASVVLAVYTLRRRRTVAARLHHAVPDSIRDLSRAWSKKLKTRPAVKVVIADKEQSGDSKAWRTIAQKVATTFAVSAATAITSRILRPRETTTPAASE
jgi:hypothetical protein